MKPVTLFYLPTCPYCRQAMAWWQQLCAENPAYAAVPLQMVDEQREAARAAQYDYYYVPTYYVGEEKVHEGVATRQAIQRVLQQALED